ncbi:hypothetical protein GJ496_011925 [Pomphorhynchus laevis]|nr:hypothetical protein GJ496_011925 [Pomphorhynchus laevis]
MEPLHVVFVICDYELNIDLCENCQKSNSTYTLLDIAGYSNQVVRQIIETLSVLRFLYCSPEDFRGHLCWNFIFTSNIHAGKGVRNLAEWYDFSANDINKMIEYIQNTRNECSCFRQGMSSARGVVLNTPFDWNLISTCIRDCIMKCRWSDRILCTPQRMDTSANSTTVPGIVSAVDPLDDTNTSGYNQTYSSLSSSLDFTTTSNHIILLGGLPSQSNIAQEYKGKHGVDRLLERLLIQNSDTMEDTIKSKAIEETCNLFKKKKIGLSIISIPEARYFLVTKSFSKYAPVVHRVVKRISSDGFFSQCAPFRHDFTCEFLQLAEHFGTIMCGFFLSLVPYDKRENRNVFSLEFTISKDRFKANCVPADSGDFLINRLLNQASDSTTLYLKNLQMVDKLGYYILFNSSPLCFGYVDMVFTPRITYFEADIVPNLTAHSNSSCTNHPSASHKVILNFFPESTLFVISVMDNNSSLTNNDINNNSIVNSLHYCYDRTFNVNDWTTKGKALRAKEYSQVDSDSMKRPLREDWKENLVPTYEHLRYMPPMQVRRSNESKSVDLFKCTADEAIREYRRYFNGLLDGSITPEISLSDFVQRALLSGGLRLRNFLNNSELWYGPVEYQRAHHAVRAKASKLFKTKREIEKYASTAINCSLMFQFETALVLGQLQDAKTPSLSIHNQDEIDSDEEEENKRKRKFANQNSIFEIVNFLRWMIRNYSNAGNTAARSLHKRNQAGCNFATMVYAEMYRHDKETSPSLRTKHQRYTINKSPTKTRCDDEHDRKRKSFPLQQQFINTGTKTDSLQNLASEFKKYAKRCSTGVSANNNFRLVNMAAAEWEAANDEFFVPETPNERETDSEIGEGAENCQNKENNENVEFSVAATPSHVYETAQDRLDAERRIKQKKSAERTARRIVVYREKLRKICQIDTEYKHPRTQHMITAKTLKYHRRLNILTNWRNVRRQLFPEYDVWYSSESSETSSDLN